MTTGQSILFFERQRFRRSWLTTVFLLGLLVPIGILVYMLTIEQVSAMELILSLVAVVALEIPIFILFYYGRLELQVMPEGFSYRWWPLQKKFRMILPYDALEIKIRESPASSYGMHWKPGYGWVNNIRAKKGFQFKLRSGKNVFIGSERISELKVALEKVFKTAIRDIRNEF